MDCYQKIDEDKTLKRIEAILGPQALIAKELGLYPSSLNNYFNRNQYMPVYVAIGIQTMTEEKQKKVTVLDLAGLLEPREKAAILVQAMKDAKKNTLEISARPVLAEQLYTYHYTGKRLIPCLKLSRYTLTEAIKQAGISDIEEYYQIKQVNKLGINELIEAMNEGIIAVPLAARLSTLAHEKQHNLMRLDAKTLQAALDILQFNNLSPELSHLHHLQTACVLPQLDYIRLLRNDNDINHLRQQLTLSTSMAIGLAFEYFADKKESQTRFSRQNSGQKRPDFDDVNTFLQQISPVSCLDNEFIEKVKAHITALEPIREDMKTYLDNIPGRTDAFIAHRIGIENRQTYRQGRYVFLQADKALIEQLDTGNISLFHAFKQLSTQSTLSNQQP